MGRWLKEPFLHFLIGGAMLFGLYVWLDTARPQAAPAARQVRIGAGEVKWLTDTWMRQWHREPSAAELRGLVSGLLREELLAREARELGLDENDTIVRRRLAQKLEFLLQDTASVAEPTEDELRRRYDASPGEYATDPRVSFEHVYFSRERRKDPRKDAAEALVTLAGARSADETGDPVLVDPDLRQADRQTVASVFGPEFADIVLRLPAGSWHGPIESGFGVHLVRVSSRDPGRRRAFEDVRAQLLERWREEKQREAEAQLLARLMTKYNVVIADDVKPLVGPVGPAMATR